MPLNQPIRQWSGRRVWLIGASAGIGLALGQSLLSEGAELMVSGRRQSALEAAFPQPQVRRQVLDVTQAGAVEAALEAAIQDDWLPEVVIWLAGDYAPQPITAPDGFDASLARRVLEVNLGSVFEGLSALLKVWLPRVAGRGGQPPFHLCLFSSVAGYRGLPKALAYSASKAGLNALAETAHLECGPLGVDVSVVCPGFVKTRLTDANDFKMPALIGPDEAARQTLRGLARGEFEIHFPKRFSRFMKLLRLLPHGPYFWLASRALHRTKPPNVE